MASMESATVQKSVGGIPDPPAQFKLMCLKMLLFKLVAKTFQLKHDTFLKSSFFDLLLQGSWFTKDAYFHDEVATIKNKILCFHSNQVRFWLSIPAAGTLTALTFLPPPHCQGWVQRQSLEQSM